MSEKRTYQQRREYMLEAVKRRRAKIRQMAVEYKGNSCQICGYNRCIEALEFHHLDPSQKDFGISAKGYARSWEKVKMKLKNVFCYVQTAIVNSMLESCSFHK
jgi:hypothetical protein